MLSGLENFPSYGRDEGCDNLAIRYDAWKDHEGKDIFNYNISIEEHFEIRSWFDLLIREAIK